MQNWEEQLFEKMQKFFGRSHLQKVESYSEDDETGHKKLYNKKAGKEQVMHQHQLTFERNKTMWFKRLAA